MRVTNRLLAVVFGAGLATVAGAVVIDAVAVVAGGSAVVLPRQPWLANVLASRWSDPLLLSLGVGFVVMGAALLVAGLVPQRPRAITLAGSSDAVTSIDRRGLEERLRHAALRDPDVAAATVRIRRAISIRAAVSAGSDPGTCRERLTRVITSALDDVGLAEARRTRVRTVSARERVR